MEVTFDKEFLARTILTCVTELDQHINESDYRYHDEICTEIELIYRLGDTRKARRYKNKYLEAFRKMISEETNTEYRKDLRALKSEFTQFWKALAA